MSEDTYTIKVEFPEVTVEVSGPDRAWVADQLAKHVESIPSAGLQSGKTQAGNRATPKKRASRKESKGSKPKTRATGGKAQVVPELKERLDPETRKKLERFVEERKTAFKDSLQKAAAIIATFLHKELGEASIGGDDLYTVYAVMGWKPPTRPDKIINNAKNRNRFFGPWSDGNGLDPTPALTPA